MLPIIIRSSSLVIICPVPLWNTVDLKLFASRLPYPVKIKLLIFKRFSNKILCLDLRGFTVLEGTLNTLAPSWKQLHVLKLKSVSSTTDSNMYTDIQLDNLDVITSAPILPWESRLSEHQIFTRQSPACFQPLPAYTSWEWKFGNSYWKHEKFAVTERQNLSLFARCSKLEVLSVRRCPMLTGSSVHLEFRCWSLQSVLRQPCASSFSARVLQTTIIS